MSRFLTLAYGLVVYALFLATFLYAMGFVNGILVPRTIDRGPESSPAWAVLGNLGLLALFAVQHSIMARRWFKERWTRIVPRAIERSTFVLATCVVLGLLYVFWRPLTGVVWEVQDPAWSIALHAFSWLGWGLVLISTFIIDHFDLFGLRQTILHAMGKPYSPPVFRESALYRSVRHPLLLGFLIAFWSAPRMTAGHLLFAVVVTAYVLVAIRFEEGDLTHAHGEAYREYRRRVPMLIPFLRARTPAPGVPARETSSKTA